MLNFSKLLFSNIKLKNFLDLEIVVCWFSKPLINSVIYDISVSEESLGAYHLTKKSWKFSVGREMKQQFS